MPIRILSPEVANQIAAGEVVERPASAVKELIENSLDTGATDLRVEVREGGRRLLRVQDDGCGIPAAEAALAFQRHATSKISSTDDLSRITTLGFRGEALASIASVGHVTLLTRTPEAEAGTLIRVIEGREVERGLAGMPAGTIVTVEHLFANVPARLKFLKQPATEAAHIQQVITRYTLAYPERRFSLVTDGKLVFQSTGSGKLYDVLAKVYGLEMARGMLEISESTNQRIDESASLPIRASLIRSIRVSGYASTPGLHRGNRGYITLFVNRRWFQDTSVAYAVIQAYHTLLPVGRYPVALIFLEMDPADVDVNVHPTKAEVRFREPGAIFSAVQKAVRKTLTSHAPVPQITVGGSPAPGAWPGDQQPHILGGEGWAERRDALLGAGQNRLFPSAELGGEPGRQPGKQSSSEAPTSGIEQPASDPQAPAAPLLPLLRVVGQLGATYIIAEGPDGLYLIDQHAAHERILYEQMLAEHTANRLAVQPLLEPLVLDLSPEQATIVAEEIETLNELGLAIEPFGGATYLVRSLPALLSAENPASALVEIIDGLAQQTDLVEATDEARLVTLICKRAAVKGNTPMPLPAMQELVRRLEACRSPRTCPHGRPTMIYMSSSELARQFGRI